MLPRRWGPCKLSLLLFRFSSFSPLLREVHTRLPGGCTIQDSQSAPPQGGLRAENSKALREWVSLDLFAGTWNLGQ